MEQEHEGSGGQRRQALGQAMGKLALLAGAGAWAMAPVLPAAAETTAVKKVGGQCLV